MSDNNLSTISIDGRVVLFQDVKPDVYTYDSIYDPDNPSSGKVIPSLLTLAIKNDGSLWYVSAIDPVTHKSTFKPISITSSGTGGSGGGDGEDGDDGTGAIISYGSDKYCVYQDTRTDPHRLVVDAKFLVYGNNLVEYALYRTKEDGTEECISMYFDSAGQFHSNRIPLASISEEYPTYKFPTNCHTTLDLTEGEPVTIRVFNNLGTIAAESTLFVRDAIWWNDLESHTNPIVSLDAECLQMRGDDFYIYAQQDPSHLNIRPYLTYANGTRKYLDIDNEQCFLYGLEDYIPSYPGKHQTLIIKYFLNHRETATVDTEGANGVKFLTCEKNLIVLRNENRYVVKLSVIPLWDQEHATWHLRFFAYNDERSAVYDVTDLVTINKDFPFDGTTTSFGREQHLVLDYDLQSIFNTDDPIKASQSLYITVWANDKYVKYTFRDSDDDNHIYGVDGSITRRPILWYDEELAQYFIPTSVFANQEAVVESFYHLADPPFNPNTETQAPTPTHFVVRDPLNGRQLNGGPVPLTEYGQSWPMMLGTTPRVNSTVLMEFLQQTSSGTYLLLYGVPVDIVAGTFNS